MRPSSYCIFVSLPDDDRSLLFHGYSGAVDLVSPTVADFLRDPIRDTAPASSSLTEETLGVLRKRGYITDKSLQEEREFVRQLGLLVHRVHRRHAHGGFLVLPTYGCNLRCPYCYERTLREKGSRWLEKQMDEEVIEAAFCAMEGIDPNPRRQKTLGLYGGEPLQRKTRPVVARILETAVRRGFTAFSAITNGVDLDAYEDLLGPDCGIGFLQITLDGPEEVHDRRRCRPDGTGTFERIAENLTRALEKNVRVSLRVNVDSENVATLERLASFVAERGWPKCKGFRAYASPVHGGVGPCGQEEGSKCFRGPLDMRRAASGAGACVEGAVEMNAVTTSLARSLARHLGHRGLPQWRTGFCGSNMAMYLFDPHGDVYPCWEVVGHPEHRIGTYGDGVLRLQEEEMRKWHGRSVVTIEKCLRCAHLFFCGGGCEAAAWRRSGAWDKPDCGDFPEIFQEAARAALREHMADRLAGDKTDSGGS